MSYSITFGDVAENHIGNQQIGSMVTEGFTQEELILAQELFESKGCLCELIKLHDAVDKPVDEAYVLVIREGLRAFDIDKDQALKEQSQLEYDKKALMRGIVKNKRARYNICFSDSTQQPDYQAGKGHIVSFSDMVCLNKVRRLLPIFLGNKATHLQAEGNYYYDLKKCGISHHGDSERRLVIAIRLGQSHPLVYQWYYQTNPVGDEVRLILNHGDVYIMSAKAVGTDWKRPSIHTLRHAAGCEKYLKPTK
jgi:alkylated DNA repair dioxygenase AlkB